MSDFNEKFDQRIREATDAAAALKKKRDEEAEVVKAWKEDAARWIKDVGWPGLKSAWEYLHGKGFTGIGDQNKRSIKVNVQHIGIEFTIRADWEEQFAVTCKVGGLQEQTLFWVKEQLPKRSAFTSEMIAERVIEKVVQELEQVSKPRDPNG